MRNKPANLNLPHDLLIVHILGEEDVFFDTWKMMEKRAREHPDNHMFYPQGSDILTHTLLSSIRADLGSLCFGYNVDDSASPVGEVDIWIVRTFVQDE